MNIPSQKTSLVMFLSLAAVIFSICIGSLAGTLIYMIDMMAHEFGHTIFGYLFGMPSFPVGMFTFHLERRWTLQIAVYLILACICFWLWRRYYTEALIGMIVFSLFIIVISLTPYYESVVLFMGHGGATIIAAFLLYYGWNKQGLTAFHHFAVCFAGYAIILHNIIIGYKLATDPVERYEYHENKFLFDNDFVRIAADYGVQIETSAAILVALGIVALVAPFIATIFKPSYIILEDNK